MGLSPALIPPSRTPFLCVSPSPHPGPSACIFPRRDGKATEVMQQNRVLYPVWFCFLYVKVLLRTTWWRWIPWHQSFLLKVKEAKTTFKNSSREEGHCWKPGAGQQATHQPGPRLHRLGRAGRAPSFPDLSSLPSIAVPLSHGTAEPRETLEELIKMQGPSRLHPT